MVQDMLPRNVAELTQGAVELLFDVHGIVARFGTLLFDALGHLIHVVPTIHVLLKCLLGSLHLEADGTVNPVTQERLDQVDDDVAFVKH